MKNFKTFLFLVWALSLVFMFAGCNNQNEINNISESEVETEVVVENVNDYEWKLVIQWVGPEISMEPTVEEWTLVLRWNFEDHTDHVFLKEWIWEKLFEHENGYLPWNIVKFKWYVKPLDAAAGNHYYDVVSIEKLENIWYADSTWVKEILEWWNYCEVDDDCAYIVWECPFGCFVPLYKDFVDIAWKVMENYFGVNGKSCIYDCPYMDKAVCENYRCIMKNSSEDIID